MTLALAGARAGYRVAARRDTRREFGEMGERIAAQHLLANGYRILARNWRKRAGEIDIVAQTGDTVAFVEVRSRRESIWGSAAESLTWAKQKRMLAMADEYAAEHPDIPEGRRVDLIAIDFGRDGRLKSLQHFESAVAT